MVVPKVTTVFELEYPGDFAEITKWREMPIATLTPVVSDLPEQTIPGVLYLVTVDVAKAVSFRRDVFVATDLVRNAHGRVCW